jgi:2-polyprenyl-3-methyl-5-hydroxy-6-metoxy-1,4-benzoquinol methylase
MGENSIPNDETSAQYTHGHADAVLRSHRWRTVANSAAYLSPFLRAGARVLDVGCGPGTLTADLAEHVAPGEVVGIDLAASVVAEANALGVDRALTNLRFELADLHSIERPEGGFDVVHAHQVLQHVTDPVGTLRAMAGLLAPEGIVAARDADYSAMTWWPAEPALDRWLEIYRNVTRSNGAECDAGRRLLHWAHEAGLDDVTYTTTNWTYSTPDDLAWWCDLWADRISRTRLAEQAIAGGFADQSELDSIAAAWRSWGERTDAVFIVPHGEILSRCGSRRPW